MYSNPNRPWSRSRLFSTFHLGLNEKFPPYFWHQYSTDSSTCRAINCAAKSAGSVPAGAYQARLRGQDPHPPSNQLMMKSFCPPAAWTIALCTARRCRIRPCHEAWAWSLKRAVVICFGVEPHTAYVIIILLGDLVGDSQNSAHLNRDPKPKPTKPARRTAFGTEWFKGHHLPFLSPRCINAPPYCVSVGHQTRVLGCIRSVLPGKLVDSGCLYETKPRVWRSFA